MELVDSREEHIRKFDNMVDDLRNMKTNGFIEDMVEKCEDHINDVHDVQLTNLKYNSDFVEGYCEQITAVDESNHAKI